MLKAKKEVVYKPLIDLTGIPKYDPTYTHQAKTAVDQDVTGTVTVYTVPAGKRARLIYLLVGFLEASAWDISIDDTPVIQTALTTDYDNAIPAINGTNSLIVLRHIKVTSSAAAKRIAASFITEEYDDYREPFASA